MDAVTETISSLPAPAARMLAVEILLTPNRSLTTCLSRVSTSCGND